MLKKIVAFMLSLIMIVGFASYFPMTAKANTGICYLFDGSVLEIRTSGNPLPDTTFSPWQSIAGKVKSVVVVDDVYPTDIDYWFMDFDACTSMDLAKLHTENVTSMESVFRNCISLTSLDVSGFNTSNVTSMNGMFYNCRGLTSLDLSSFNTSNVTDIRGMFGRCASLTAMPNMSSFDFSGITDMSNLFDGCTSLVSVNTNVLDTSNATYLSGIFSNCTSLTTVNTLLLDTSNATTLSKMFYNCKGLSAIDLSGFETSNVTNFSYMFSGCTGLLTPLDISPLDTSSATSMEGMFESYPLPTLDISSLDTSNVTSMEGMFSKSKLTSIDMTGFDTSNVKNMSYMFYNCSYLQSLDLSPLDTSACTDMSYMFYGYPLQALNVSALDTSGVTTMKYMFGNSSLQSLDLSTFSTSACTNMSFMFLDCGSLTTLNISDFNTASVTTMESMFSGCTLLTPLDVSDFNTSNVTTMSGMFNGCKALNSLDVSGFNTSKVKSMSYMFSSCKSLPFIDVSGFITTSVTTMGSMFSNCSQLNSLNVSGFNTSNVVSMDYMFSDCSSLTSLDVSGFDVAKVKKMDYMFRGCRLLTTIDVSGFVTTSVTGIDSMFDGCVSVTELDVSGFNTSKITTMRNMFSNCRSLTSLDVSSFNTSNVVYMEKMFYRCSSLKSLDLSGFNTDKVYRYNLMFTNCSELEFLDISSFDTSRSANTETIAMLNGCVSLKKLITTKAGLSGVSSIALPKKMVEENSTTGAIYSTMPLGALVLVPFEYEYLENITDTTLCYKKYIDHDSTYVPTYDFNVCSEDGTVVTTVQNDSLGNILIETEGFAAGQYSVEEVKGTDSTIYYDPVKYYFTVEEKNVSLGTGSLVDGGKYAVPIDNSIFTNPNNKISVNAHWIYVYDENDTTVFSGHAYTMRADKDNVYYPSNSSFVCINPTLEDINEAMGFDYQGSQTDLVDALRCMFYFNGSPKGLSNLRNLLYGETTIDTSRKNEIPDWFTLAIIKPAANFADHGNPVLVPLVIYKSNVTGDEIETGSMLVRTIDSDGGYAFNNLTSVTSYPISIEKRSSDDSSFVVGASLALHNSDGYEVDRWTSGTEAHVFDAIAGTYTLKELSAPVGFAVAEDIIFTVGDDGSVTVGGSVLATPTIVMTDQVVQIFQITINKRETTNHTMLAGATLAIYDSNNVEVERWVTGTESHVFNAVAGSYTLNEIEAPYGYTTAGQIPFTVAEDGSLTVGTIAYAQPVITMFDELDGEYFYFEKRSTFGTTVEGAKLAIFYGDTKVAEWVTDGTAYEVFLPRGTYTLRELETPEGYLTAEDIVFVITDDYDITVDGVVQDDWTLVMIDKRQIPNAGINMITASFVCSLFAGMMILGYVLITKKRKKFN